MEMNQNTKNSQKAVKQKQLQNLSRLRQILDILPGYCEDYFIAAESSTSILTRINYAHDFKIFFQYLAYHVSEITASEPKDITCADLDSVSPQIIERFLSYTTLYESESGLLRDNQASGKERKLSSIRSLYKYLQRHEKCKLNPAALATAPKKHEKPIMRLEPNEVAALIRLVENGEGLTPRQQKIQEKTRKRDMALLTLMLGTGIRVSECVGIDMDDVNFDAYSFRVIRKGGAEAILYFGDTVRNALLDYFEERKQIVPAEPQDQNALFLSLQRKRIDVRSIENLVKKYSRIAAPLKKISPHKLRSTFGTNLYNESGDIYLVADVLGHSDINTTRRHYAAQSDENRRKVIESIKLRDDE